MVPHREIVCSRVEMQHCWKNATTIMQHMKTLTSCRAFYKSVNQVLHCFYGKLIVDLSCLDSKFAWLCLKLRIGYCGMAFTEHHVQLLEKDLFEKMQSAMLDPSTRWHNPHFAQAMKHEAASAEDEAAKAAAAAAEAQKLAEATITAQKKNRKKAGAANKSKAKAKASAADPAEAPCNQEGQE